jgi:hypothetical protein
MKLFTIFIIATVLFAFPAVNFLSVACNSNVMAVKLELIGEGLVYGLGFFVCLISACWRWFKCY